MEHRMPTPEVLLEHRRFMLALARSLLRDEHAAEDVVQDATVAALTKPPRPGNLRAWLGKVTRHLALTRRRGELRRERRHRAAGWTDAAPATADSVARLELQRRVVDLVLALDEPYRAVIVHRFFDDLALKEIARRLDVPLETVRTRLRRALAQLRARLDADHAGDRRAWSLVLLPLLAAPARAGLAASVKGGVLVMAWKLKLAAVLVILGLLAWLAVEQWGSDAMPARVASHEVEPPPPPAEPGVPVDTPKTAGVDFAALDRDRDLHGTVVGETGAPVAGARVEAVRRPWLALADMAVLAAGDERPGPRTATGSDGTFALRLRRGEQVALRVHADGFAAVERRRCLAGGRVEVVLPRGRRLTVRVVDDRGAVLAGARLLLTKPNATTVEAGGSYLAMEGRTDEDGRCVFGGLVSREARFVVVLAEGAGTRAMQPVEAGAEEVEVVVPPARTVRGRVVDAATGEPVAGASVATSWVPFFAATTGADGRYALTCGPTDARQFVPDARLFVRAEGFAVAERPLGDEPVLDIELRRGRIAIGRVVDRAGRPVPDALVIARGTGVPAAETRSGPDGRFTLRGVPDGAKGVNVIAPGYTFAGAPLGTGDVGDVALQPGLRVEGVVQRDDGTPLDGVRVSFKGKRLFCLTDDLGRFRFADLSVSEGSLRVHLSDGREVERKVEAGAEDVVFVVDNSKAVVVLVTDPAGRPVAGADVFVFGEHGRLQARTDADGRARFAIQADVLRVSVRTERDDLKGGDWFAERVRDGKVAVTLAPAALITGRVFGPDGEPFGPSLLLAQGERGPASAIIKPNGSFRLKVGADAVLDLFLTGEVRDGFAPIAGRLDGVAAGTRGVVIRARRVAVDRTLRVQVVDPDGNGVAGARLVVPEMAAQANREARTGDDGYLNLEALPAAPFDVAVQNARAWRAKWAAPHPVRVVPAGQEIVLRFRATVAVTGRVLLPDGSPYRHLVELWRDRTFLASARTDESGAFRVPVPADEPGPVRVQVRPWQFAPHRDLATAEVDGVEPGGPEVVIRLRTER